MNFEIISPKRRPTFEVDPKVSPDNHFQSTDTIQRKLNLQNDFFIVCPSPDINIFDVKQALNVKSTSEYSSRDLNTEETVLNYDNELESFHSFELLSIEDRSIRPRSLPKERFNTDSELEIWANKSAENNFALKLKSMTTTEKKFQAETLNKEINELLIFPDAESTASHNNNTSINLDEIIEKVSHVGCNCKKSKCLRLHCVCFAELRECGFGCKCLECKNTGDYKEIRDFVIEKTKEINPLAFKPKIKNYKGINVNSRGCNCSKNHCLKRYCECFKSGSGCTKLCLCVGCKNSFDVFGRDDIIDIKDKGYRRKHKIVINEPQLDKRELSNQDKGVSFIKHKKKRKSRTNL